MLPYTSGHVAADPDDSGRRQPSRSTRFSERQGKRQARARPSGESASSASERGVLVVAQMGTDLADNATADAITRPAREEIVRLTPSAFARAWTHFGAFNINIMASSESAHTIPC